MDRRLGGAEKAGIVIDIGVKLTKIGICGENIPRSIIRTPSSLFKDITELNQVKY